MCVHSACQWQEKGWQDISTDCKFVTDSEKMDRTEEFLRGGMRKGHISPPSESFEWFLALRDNVVNKMFTKGQSRRAYGVPQLTDIPQWSTGDCLVAVPHLPYQCYHHSTRTL